MSKNIKNYLLFILSLAVMGFGIALVTKSGLGTSAVSSVPYVLSKVFPKYTFGMFTFAINMLYYLIQIIILRKDFPKSQYLQIIVGPFLGFFIDLSMSILSNLNLDIYLLQLLILVIGCFIVAYSIWLQLLANVVINPTEGIVKVLSDKLKIVFSSMKTYFDIFLVIASCLISYIGLSQIVGVREGTLISAFLVGYFIRLINKIVGRDKNVK